MNKVVSIALLLAACGGSTTPVHDARDENEPAPRTAVSLRLSDLSGDAPPPRSSLDLVLVHDHADREIIRVSEIIGICTPEAEPPRGILAAIQCWWEGTDTVYSAQRVGDVVEVRRASETILEAAVPPGVETHALHE